MNLRIRAIGDSTRQRGVGVFINYKLFDKFPDLDRFIRDLAERLGGKDMGSGAAFPSSIRDLEFDFPTENHALLFVGIIKRSVDKRLAKAINLETKIRIRR